VLFFGVFPNIGPPCDGSARGKGRKNPTGFALDGAPNSPRATPPRLPPCSPPTKPQKNSSHAHAKRWLPNVRGLERKTTKTTTTGAAGFPGLDDEYDDDANQPCKPDGPHHHHPHLGGWNPGGQNDKPSGLLLGSSVSLPNLGATAGGLGDGPAARRLAGERKALDP